MLRGYTPSVKVLFGTFGAIASIIAAGFAIWLLGLAPGFATIELALNGVVGDANVFLAVIVLGAVGGLVSLWARIGQFAKPPSTPEEDPFALLFTGLLKPFVGAAFAVFAYGVINAGILPIAQGEDDAETFLAPSVAFLAGFSERFVNDLVSRADSSGKGGFS